MRLLYILIFALISFGVFGQSTGYKGKHLSFSYTPSITPSFTSPTSRTSMIDASENDIAVVRFGLQHGIELNYIINRRVTMGLTYQTYKTKAYSDEIRVEGSNNYDYYYSYDYNYAEVLQPIKMDGIGAYLKYFKGDDMAPIGSYVKFHFELYKCSILQPVKTLYPSSVSPYTIGKYDSQITNVEGEGFMVPKVSVTLGNQRMITNNLFLNACVIFGTNLVYTEDGNSLFNILDDPLGTDTYDTDYFQYNSYDPNELAKTRLMWYSLVNVSLGVGWMIL